MKFLVKWVKLHLETSLIGKLYQFTFPTKPSTNVTLTISMATKQAMVVFQSLSKDAFPTSKL